jgi:hypothetical protein
MIENKIDQGYPAPGILELHSPGWITMYNKTHREHKIKPLFFPPKDVYNAIYDSRVSDVRCQWVMYDTRTTGAKFDAPILMPEMILGRLFWEAQERYPGLPAESYYELLDLKSAHFLFDAFEAEFARKKKQYPNQLDTTIPALINAMSVYQDLFLDHLSNILKEENLLY